MSLGSYFVSAQFRLLVKLSAESAYQGAYLRERARRILPCSLNRNRQNQSYQAKGFGAQVAEALHIVELT